MPYGTSVRYLDDPKRWRDRAEEARTQAEHMSTDEARKSMLFLAACYDRMAMEAEHRLSGGVLPLCSSDITAK